MYVDRVATIKHHGYRPAPGPGTGEQQVRPCCSPCHNPVLSGKRTGCRPWLEAFDLFARDVGQKINASVEGNLVGHIDIKVPEAGSH